MGDNVERLLGELCAEVKNIKEDITSIKATQQSTSDFLSQVRGGQKLLWLLAIGAGSLVVFGKNVVDFIHSFQTLKG